MKIETMKFLARQRADIDWQSVGGNENPYSKGSIQHAEYDSYFDQIRTEWNDFIGSAA